MRWNDVYPDFIRALRSPEPFDPFRWVTHLAWAFLGECLHRFESCGAVLIPLLPWFAVFLIFMVDLAYLVTLRPIFRVRWCPTSADKEACLWTSVHDVLVAYFSIMILFHYIKTSYTTPGIMLSESTGEIQWKATRFQGGFLGINARCDTKREQLIVDTFRRFKACKTPLTSDIPSLVWTQCETCQIPVSQRPPRCHHCRVCQRCILQFDHHCIWLNQCIGYHNYRHFVLLLFFLMTGCWYSVMMLFFPFYEPLKVIIDQHGIWHLAKQGIGIPGPFDMYDMLRFDGMPDHVVINVVYPLTLGVGAVLSVFMGYHLKYILTARTTLEHHMRLTKEYNHAIGGEPPPIITNPYDQGWRNNLRQILGDNLLLILLPISIAVPIPFIPNIDGKCK